MKRLTLSVLFFCFITPSLYAATMVELLEKDNSVSRIWLNDKYARMNSDDKQQHAQTEYEGPKEMIVDIKHKKMYGVIHKTKTLVEISNFSIPGMPKPPALPKIKFTLDSEGSGPAVAGFSTHKYLVRANGATCFTAFFSKDVLKYRELGTFYDVMAKMAPQESYASEPCEAAEEHIDKLPKEKYGLVLKLIDAHGERVSEIKQIKDGVNPPRNYLQLPSGYKKMSMMQMMQQMQGKMPMQMPTQ